MKHLPAIIVIVVCALLASLYIYPVFSGLILLPLDLLVSNSGPWHFASTILLKNSYMQDSIIQMFPWKHLTFVSLTHGIIPLWNPYQFLGMPFMAAMKPLVFYPANVLFVLGEVQAWNILLWLQLFLGLWFTYLLVTSFGIGPLFALLAGISYSFNSLMVSTLEFGSEGQVLLWLPALLYLVKKYTETKNLRYGVGIAVATACAVFAGQLQYFAYVMTVVVAFTLYWGKMSTKSFKVTVPVLLAIVLGAFIAAIQLLPGIELFSFSYRWITGSYSVFAGGLLKPYHLLRLLSPDWFGNPVTHDLHTGYIETSGYFGVIPLFFAVYAFVYQRKHTFVRFLSGVAVLALLFSLDGIAQILYVLRIPVITSGYGGRMFAMFLFAGGVLSAFGFSAFVKDQSERSKTRALLFYLGFVGLCFTFGLVLARWNGTVGVHLGNVKFQIAGVFLFIVAALGYVKIGKKIPYADTMLILFVLVLTFGDLFRMGYRFLTFSNEKFLYPDMPVTAFVRREQAKSLGREYGLTEPEINTALGVTSVETYNPLYPLRTAELLMALEDKPAGTLANNKYYLTKNPRMKYVLDFLGVTLIVVPTGVNPAITLWNDSVYEKDLTKVYSDAQNDVYQNLTVNPRFGMYYDVRTGISDKEALSAITSSSVDFKKTVLIREQLSARILPGSGSAQLESHGLNDLTFRAHTDTAGIFYLSDSYFPGWHASVNGKEVPVLHANYNFRAIEVPAGNSKVRFWYLPASVVAGAALSVLGLLLTIGLLIKSIRRQ